MADLGNSLAETQPGLTFVGTGLLDLEPDMEDASSASRPLEFIPNGLLGPPDSPSPIAQSQDIEMLSTISDDAFRDPMVDSASLASQLMFVSNGLLDITEPDGPGLPDDGMFLMRSNSTFANLQWLKSRRRIAAASFPAFSEEKSNVCA